MGESGESGNCLVGDCKTKTVQIMVEEAIQNFKEEEDITPMERKTICNMVNDNGNKRKINLWILPDLQAFRNYLYKEADYSSIANLDERIKNQNSGSDDLVWLKDLIRYASNKISATNKRLANVTTDASECN